jgi:hypothetical protein
MICSYGFSCPIHLRLEGEYSGGLSAIVRKQAHKILAEIHGWFIEGFNMGDLQEAKALLETLVA